MAGSMMIRMMIPVMIAMAGIVLNLHLVVLAEEQPLPSIPPSLPAGCRIVLVFAADKIPLDVEACADWSSSPPCLHVLRDKPWAWPCTLHARPACLKRPVSPSPGRKPRRMRETSSAQTSTQTSTQSSMRLLQTSMLISMQISMQISLRPVLPRRRHRASVLPPFPCRLRRKAA